MNRTSEKSKCLIPWDNRDVGKNQCHVGGCGCQGNRREIEGYCVSYSFYFFNNISDKKICWNLWEKGQYRGLEKNSVENWELQESPTRRKWENTCHLMVCILLCVIELILSIYLYFFSKYIRDEPYFIQGIKIGWSFNPTLSVLRDAASPVLEIWNFSKYKTDLEVFLKRSVQF